MTRGAHDRPEPRTPRGTTTRRTTTDYGITVRVPDSFATTVERVRAALREQGFGVLTEIDVQATLQEKLGEQMEDYLILGACNPSLAHRALGVHGLRHRRPDLAPVADEAERRLTAALRTLND